MRGVTQVLFVKARLVASAMPDEVQAIASALHVLHDPLPVAAICLATFDGDAAHCDHVLRSVLDSRDWVAGTFRRRAARGLPTDMRSTWWCTAWSGCPATGIAHAVPPRDSSSTVNYASNNAR